MFSAIWRARAGTAPGPERSRTLSRPCLIAATGIGAGAHRPDRGRPTPVIGESELLAETLFQQFRRQRTCNSTTSRACNRPGNPGAVSDRSGEEVLIKVKPTNRAWTSLNHADEPSSEARQQCKADGQFLDALTAGPAVREWREQAVILVEGWRRRPTYRASAAQEEARASSTHRSSVCALKAVTNFRLSKSGKEELPPIQLARSSPEAGDVECGLDFPAQKTCQRRENRRRDRMALCGTLGLQLKKPRK